MRSRGDALGASVHSTYSVDVHDAARRSYRPRPRSSSTSSSSTRCKRCCTPCLAKASSVSHSALDSSTDSVLFFLTGGVSFCSGVDRARGSYGEPKVTPPSLVSTPSDVTSETARRALVPHGVSLSKIVARPIGFRDEIRGHYD